MPLLVSWLKAATTAFTFKTLLRHYAQRALTPRSLNVKLGPRRKYHSCFQPGEGPSRGRDCTSSPINRFAALDATMTGYIQGA